MDQAVLEIARAARSGSARLGASRLITIDGPAGGGKSTLAHELARELGETAGTGATGGPAGRGQTPPAHGLGTEVDSIGGSRGLGENGETSGPAGRGQSTPAQGAGTEVDSIGDGGGLGEASGPAGSGKSMPAHGAGIEVNGIDEIRGLGEVATIHMDDLYEGWTGLDPKLFNRLEAWIILPLANSLPARFLAYDWAQARFTRWVEVPPARYLIIEGVGAGDAVTREWATTKVWLDVSDETGLSRGLTRDTPGRSTSRANQELHEQWSIWQRRQADYFATSGNRSSAEFRIDTTQP